MDRVALTDETGGWFDKDKAEKFEEDTFWNGSNHISKATGSQWAHEELYRTASGNWVLYSWSQMQGSVDTWEHIDGRDATSWLIENDHDVPEDLEQHATALEL